MDDADAESNTRKPSLTRSAIRVDRLEAEGRRRAVGAVDKLPWLPCTRARHRCVSAHSTTYLMEVFRQKRECALVRRLHDWECRCGW